MNDTMEENGLVATNLVFGRFPIISIDLNEMKERMEVVPKTNLQSMPKEASKPP